MLIPHNYWKGENTLNLEYPWITPGSIEYLIDFIKPNHTVLEFGSGGSTLFFGRRASTVLSFETLSDWYPKIKEKILENKLQNIDLRYETSFDKCLDIIGNKKFDVVLDDVCDIDRVLIAKLSLEKWLNPGGVLVVDNYAASYCKGLGQVCSNADTESLYFNDQYWAGSGTAIFKTNAVLMK